MEHKQKRKRIIMLVLVLLLLIALMFSLHRCRDEPITTQPTTTESKTLDFVPASEQENDRITIPGVTGLCLQHGQLNQTVNFFNPEKNNCYFVISLYLSDNTLIYQSDYIAPGEKVTDIRLLHELKRGIYKNCIMSYKCYSLDGKTQLNGTNNRIEINAQ